MPFAYIPARSHMSMSYFKLFILFCRFFSLSLSFYTLVTIEKAIHHTHTKFCMADREETVATAAPTPPAKQQQKPIQF